MPENKHLRFLLRLLYAALTLGAVWLGGRFLLPWLLPFLLAWGLAAALEPAVTLLRARFRLPRRAAAALCTLALAALLCGGLWLLVWRAWYELGLLLERLPTLLSGLPALGTALEEWLYRCAVALPVRLQAPFRESVESLARQGAALPDKLYDWLGGLVSGTVSALPQLFLFLFTTLLAAYFLSAERPGIRAALRRRIPAAWLPRLREGRIHALRTVGGWLKAQGVLMAVTFGEVLGGLLLLRVEPAVLPAVGVAVVDALPVFGAGVVLVPWALAAFLTGSRWTALGLFLLFVAVTVVRSILEPRLVGGRLGLHPLLALAAMYVGFQAFGVAGMILAPLAAAAGKSAWDAGLFRPLPPRGSGGAD